MCQGALPTGSTGTASRAFDISATHLEVDLPDPTHSVDDVQEQFVRDKELDPKLYHPADVARPTGGDFPKGFKIEIPKMVLQKIEDKLSR